MIVPTCLQNQIESRATCRAKPQAIFQTRTQAKKNSVVLPLRPDEEGGGDDLVACYFFCGAPMMGYHNGEDDFPKVEAVFESNQYTMGWWGQWMFPGNGKHEDRDLDLVKNAAEFFEKYCAASA